MRTIKIYIKIRMELHAALIMLVNSNVDLIEEQHGLSWYVLKCYDYKVRLINTYRFEL